MKHILTLQSHAQNLFFIFKNAISTIKKNNNLKVSIDYFLILAILKNVKYSFRIQNRETKALKE